MLRAARLSAGVSTDTLAGTVGVVGAIVRTWEDGSEQLSLAPLPDVEKLTAALSDLGASQELTGDLEAAIWCDVVLLAIAGREDIRCLMADPAATEVALLLAWAMAGLVPARYRSYAVPGAPLAHPMRLR